MSHKEAQVVQIVPADTVLMQEQVLVKNVLISMLNVPLVTEANVQHVLQGIRWMAQDVKKSLVVMMITSLE